MDDFILKVKCPNDGSECSIVGGEIMESMVLLGDGEQNMQCLACGYASNSNMKTTVQPLPDDFLLKLVLRGVCRGFQSS